MSDRRLCGKKNVQRIKEVKTVRKQRKFEADKREERKRKYDNGEECSM